MNNPSKQNKLAIWQVVATIPRGKVVSYGGVAKMAGMPNAARFVGTTLRNLPKETSLPWHRVVRASGELAFPVDSQAYNTQKRKLLAEGVVFNKHKIATMYFLAIP